ncbi:helix-turn-helix domain-containing protein [Necropsobacter massiliensis]|uniref:helix-turn-helix domain-containing protein n=1 Tax=Necropsobacter massiliensis TaxID=1400001 RepID=UPI000509D65F|nr:LysR family transcriptional regulator [Necropsobacter massiliensis]
MDNSFYGQLNVFQTIAQESSISAAARKLQIAVPSASQSLKLLEQKIGVPLFHRTKRSIHLTGGNTLRYIHIICNIHKKLKRFR